VYVIRWNTEKENLLTDMPYLYDMTTKGYRNRMQKRKASVQEIA